MPSTLTLATVPVSINFAGMGFIYMESNGMSTVNDPSGMVQVDTPPPPAPNPSPGASPSAGDGGWLPAWFANGHRQRALGLFEPSMVEMLP